MNTKKKILKTTGDLFSKRGYFGVSMQDIADEVGIKKSSLYYHFKSKEDLAHVLISQAVKKLKLELKEVVKQSRVPSGTILGLIKTFLDFKIKHPELSLLVTLGFSTDEKMPLVQEIVNIRIELTKFIRDLIIDLHKVRRAAYKSLYVATTSLVSFICPFHKKGNTGSLASDLTDLMFSKYNK